MLTTPKGLLLASIVAVEADTCYSRGAIAPASVEGSETEISGISSAPEGKRYGVVALDPFGASYKVVSEI